MEEFKQRFIEEADNLLVSLESSLLDLENKPANSELIEEIFRVMHTLKGVSGMYGFDNVAEYTHQLETIYDLVRSGELNINADILDITLKSVDHLRNLLKEDAEKDPKNNETHQELTTRVAVIIAESSKGLTKKNTKKKVKLAIEVQNKSTFYIIFRLEEHVLNRGINLLKVFNELFTLGEYKIVTHSFPEDQVGQQAWGIYLVTTKGAEALEDALLFISDNCSVLHVSDFDLFSSNEDTIQNTEVQDFIDEPILKKALEAKRIEKTPPIEKPQPIELQIEEEEEEIPTPIIIEKVEKEPETQAVRTEMHNIGKQLTSRISVDSHKLDRLMYLVSELVTTKAQLTLVAESKEYAQLNTLVEKIDKLSKQFRDNALSIRLIPINDLVIRFRRLIRDLSLSLHKEINFLTQGTDTELDKTLIDTLAEPIMHILRNCIDHGIESPEEREAKGKERQGTITFSAYYSGTNVYIRIADDGNGINPEIILKKAIEKGFVKSTEKLSREEIYELIFLPGFSTAQSLTEVSGRGVGMDVVKRKISEVRGEVEVESEVGVGTAFTIKLQQTISIIDTLLIKVSQSYFLVPISEIQICGQEMTTTLFATNNRRIEFDDELIPFISLREEFHLKGEHPDKEKLIIINKSNRRVALLADKIIGEHQAVLKPLGQMFRGQEFLAGASIMGDGNVALMLDTNKLITYVSKNYY